MKILSYIFKSIAIMAGWLLGILLLFGNMIKPIIYYQALSTSLAVIALYFAFCLFCRKVNEA